ncbi:hypothetical protein, partial [Rugosimonospora africana]|uniref:hypothetical protein n=1 Tax=Rugosimonospora africana TaxID=556532 RepID=UPI001945A4EF
MSPIPHPPHPVIRRRPTRVTAALIAVAVALLAGYTAIAVGQAQAADTLLSQGKPATASSA